MRSTRRRTNNAPDFMPLHGIDQVELWVDAKQPALIHTRLRIREAYNGLETGLASERRTSSSRAGPARLTGR